ncbi:Uncharacterised protein [Mycobacteroides abscessus subsp. abscessus]|nr:Uncharacterised protein [Mycobacteroides abscessus subsp. abscessus]
MPVGELVDKAFVGSAEPDFECGVGWRRFSEVIDPARQQLVPAPCDQRCDARVEFPVGADRPCDVVAVDGHLADQNAQCGVGTDPTTVALDGHDGHSRTEAADEIE